MCHIGFAIALAATQQRYASTGRKCGMNKNVHILVNFGQSEDQSPLSSMQNLGFFEHENAKKIKKGAVCGYQTQ